MAVYLREKCGTIYLEYKMDGRKKWENTHLRLTGDPVQDRDIWLMAKEIASLRERSIIAGEWGLQDPETAILSVDSYAAMVAKRFPKSYRLPKALKYIREYSRGLQLASASTAWVEGFASFLKDQKHLSDTTKAHYFLALKNLFKTAHRENAITRNPAEYVKGLTVPEPEKVWLTMEELSRLKATEPRNSPLGREIRKGFLFCCYTGLRFSDVSTLTWGEIRRDPPQLMKRQAKTRRFVGVPIHKSAWEVIKDEAIHPKDELVFPVLTESHTQHAGYFRQWEKKAQVDHHIGWHTARHTFAVFLLENGADLYTVSKLLGHTSIKTTEVYAKATDSMKRAAIDRLPDLATITGNSL